MGIKDLIRICNIEPSEDGKSLKIWEINKGKENFEEIKAKKQEILNYFAEKAAKKEAIEKARQEKIDAIEGLKEIRAAIEAEERYAYLFEKMTEDEYNDGVNPPTKPTVSLAELRAKYPQAAAYIKAENWSYAAHYKKSSCGLHAMNQIREGEDYQKAIAEMEKEWSAYCEEHIWD